MRQQMALMPAYAHISECALAYASALLDPENTGEGACIPYGFPTPSMKQKVFTRGKFALGTTGQGFIRYTPNTTNDGTALFLTGATSVGTGSTALNAYTNITNVALTKLMFSTANVVTTNAVAARVVSGGIKIRYCGTESGRNGTMVGLEAPDHLSLGGVTPDQVATYMNSFVERPDPLGAFFTVLYSGPVKSTETEFVNNATPCGSPVVICIDGVAGDKYEYECYQHVEYCGQLVPGLSASHADPVQYSKILESVKQITQSQPLSDKNAPGGFKHWLTDAGTNVKNLLMDHGPDLLGMISNALLPGSGLITAPLTRALLGPKH
jgi:hypothetical protein